ncbi:DNA binding protein, putative [Ricinus communis]|uniref:DNA binding protein, putative n=1 Tax=Ricinus communis TaxID=3988 RepID=B9T5M6_RICCO|nr:DNA binding protein, putative [Ricinus communis]
MVKEAEESLERNNDTEIRVSLFDNSIDNYLNAIDKISKLCGETVTDSPEIQQLSSSITFLREWKYYYCEPKTIRFSCELESCQEKGFLGEVNLPQFSSVAVPRKEKLYGGSASSESSNDFIMHVGGSVWALDWCPRTHERPADHIKCEFVAVAAHPPDSYYHKIGASLTGRGIVQIWCILNVSGNDEETPLPLKKSKQGTQNEDACNGESALVKRPKGRPRKKQLDESSNDEATKQNCTQFKRPRGRPRKKQIEEALNAEATNESLTKLKKTRGRPRKKANDDLDNIFCNNQYVQALAVEYPEDSSQVLAIEGISENTQRQIIGKNKGKKRKSCTEAFVQDPAVLNCGLDNVSGEINTGFCSIPKDVALPRVVLCIAHDAKVVWDVKWQPCYGSDSKCQHRMGYLAVLLGNGFLEVWDVPLPHVTKVIYSSSNREGTDPRYVKLKPVFRGSIAKRGEIQSIPLTVEWSTSYPHDYLLAGCHDGTVALWKFSASGLSGDTRPLLCFSADTVAIRAVAWAPAGSDQESDNVIVTGGHGGLKFWDIRDPFRPLWDLHPAPKFIYSLDWLPDPRCIILSFDDGTLRLLSLVKAAYDAHVNGQPSVGPKQQGIQNIFNFSSFAIWSVQVSRKTGLAAYSSADGTVCRFQLTTKAVEKSPSRHRTPHFMVGSLSKDEAAITVNIPLPDTPLTLKKPVNTVGDNPRSMRSLLESNQTKRANINKANALAADNQLLALCDVNDPGVQSESDESLAAFRSRTKSKSKSISKKMTGEDLALVCIDEGQNNRRQKEIVKAEVANEIEVIPPKIIAMHRVRWNINKGSERWLCSGGAAGIVRCQEIILSDTDKLLARKR